MHKTSFGLSSYRKKEKKFKADALICEKDQRRAREARVAGQGRWGRRGITNLFLPLRPQRFYSATCASQALR